MKTYLSWSVVYAHDADLDIGHSTYFKPEITGSPYTSLKVPSLLCYIGTRLNPTQKLHVEIKRRFSDLKLVGNNPRFPYNIVMADGSRMQIMFSVLVFQPRIISFSFKTVGPIPHSLRELAANPEILNFRDNTMLNELLIQVVSLLTGGESKQAGSLKYDHFPILDIQDIESEHFPSWQEQFRQPLTKILIRSMSSGAVRDELVQKLFMKSEQFNYKSSEEYLLVDKQGILMLSAPVRSKANKRARTKTLKSATHLASLAQIYRAYLVNFIGLRVDHQLGADFILSRIQPWCRHPSAVLNASVTNMHLWDLLSSEYLVNELFDMLSERSYISNALAFNAESFDTYALKASASRSWFDEVGAGVAHA